MLRAPFINMLEAGMKNGSGLLVAACMGHVSKGSKKDSECIAKLFIPHMERICPDKTRCVNFYISSSMSHIQCPLIWGHYSH